MVRVALVLALTVLGADLGVQAARYPVAATTTV